MKIKKDKYAGMDAIRLSTGRAEMLVLTQAGPRIMELKRPGGKNILFQDQENRSYGNWKLRGGHRVWITRPEADEAEETYADDNVPCEVQENGNTVSITGQIHPVFKIRMGLEISATPQGDFIVANMVKNESVMLWSGGLWALTCTDPEGGKTYGLPLGRGGEWDGFLMYVPKKWAGHTSLVNDPQLQWNEDLLIVHPQGREAKRALQVPRGWIGCHAPEQGCSFFKLTKYDPAGQYPLGCNMAFYIGPDNFMAEMETMGPQGTVRPGETIRHEEKWILTEPLPWDRIGDIQRAIGAG